MKLDFNVDLTYSKHCYSEELKGDKPEGAYVFMDRDQERIFCPNRHAYSLSLPGLVNEFFAKPTTSVQKVKWKSNWVYYRLSMTPPLKSGHRYYVFFNIKQKLIDRDTADPYFMSMYIESAYARDEPVGVEKRLTFGQVAEETIKPPTKTKK